MNKAFTLIELLVVISIISLLSSVVLSSLNSARNDSRDAAIKSQVLEMRKLMEMEFLATGSYTNLERSWVKTPNAGGSNQDCSTRGYSGTYSSNFIQICENMAQIIEQAVGLHGNAIYTSDIGGVGTTDKYSIMAKLASDQYFCAGSNGAISDIGNSGNGWTDPGCYGDTSL